jgi:hypothetical protein
MFSKFFLLLNRYLTDYYTDEAEFLDAVEKEATTFKPLGDLIHSYTRPSQGGPIGKGKGVADNGALDPESEDTVAFEAYHVSGLPGSLFDCFMTLENRQHGVHPGLKSIIVECNYLYCSTLKEGHTLTKRKIYGSSSHCQ